MRALSTVALAVACMAVISASASAATFYVDPAGGSMAGDGSAAQPWRTLEEVFSGGLIESRNATGGAVNPGAPVKAGDTILLRSGYHGDINVSGYHNDATITVAAEPGHTPQLRRLRVLGFENWVFKGLTISTELSPSFAFLSGGLVEVYSNSSAGNSRYVTIEDCFVYSVLDTSGFSAGDWLSKTSHGIIFGDGGSYLTARGNRVLNVDMGITASSTDSLIRENEVVNFRGDGVRALNDNLTIEYNTIKNAFDVDDNHDDGIQVFKTNVGLGLVRNMIIRGNTVINAEDPNQPLQSTLQGIGLFDGPHENFVIENNLVITDHWHGIALYRGSNCRIVNNTAYNPKWIAGQSGLRTWITIEQSNDCLMRNNIAHTFRTVGNTNLTLDHNLVVDGSSYASVFVDSQNGDFHLKPGSAAIDAGSSTDAPPLDIERNIRPAGAAWDIGAYEFGSTAGLLAYAGPDQTIMDGDGNGWEAVTLNGSGSYDPDGSITSWVWKEGTSVLVTGQTAQVVLSVGVHTITLTVTDDDSPANTATDTVVVTINESGPITSLDGWQSFSIAEQAGSFTAQFDARPNAAGIDGLVGILQGVAYTWSDVACIFRFNVSGNMDVRNGSTYMADVTAGYAAGTWYHVRMEIDIPSHTYSVYVTPAGQAEFALATGYAFRSEQSSVAGLDHWALRHQDGGSLTVEHLYVVDDAPPQITGWEVLADHGPAGTIATAVMDDYIESRIAGLQQLRITFDRPIDPATVAPGAVTLVGQSHGDQAGLIDSLSLNPGGTVLTVLLSSPAPNADAYTLALTNQVRDYQGLPVAGDRDIRILALTGDVNGSGSVTSADMLAIRSHGGAAAADEHLRHDVDGSGIVTAADVRAVRRWMGSLLPAP